MKNEKNNFEQTVMEEFDKKFPNLYELNLHYSEIDVTADVEDFILKALKSYQQQIVKELIGLHESKHAEAVPFPDIVECLSLPSLNTNDNGNANNL